MMVDSCDTKPKVTQSLSTMFLEGTVSTEFNMSYNKQEVKSHAASEGFVLASV